jgi:hypothetical protein
LWDPDDFEADVEMEEPDEEESKETDEMEEEDEEERSACIQNDQIFKMKFEPTQRT